MERRCQQVIDGCIALGADNPMLSIHDIGAGGLSNGLPELVEATGGRFYLRNIHNEDSSVAHGDLVQRIPRALRDGRHADRIDAFTALCTRERCPVAIVGEATDDGQLVLEDLHFKNKTHRHGNERPPRQDPEDA